MGEIKSIDNEQDFEIVRTKRNILMTLWFMAIISFCWGWVVFYFITSPILDEYLIEIGLSLIGYAFIIPIIIYIIYVKIFRRLRKIFSISQRVHDICRIAVITSILPFIGLFVITNPSISTNGRPIEFIPLFVISSFFTAPLIGILIILYASIRTLKTAKKEKRLIIIQIFLIINVILFIVIIYFYAIHPHFSKAIMGPVNFISWIIIGMIFFICSMFVMNSIKIPLNIPPIDRKKLFINCAFILISLLILLLIYFIFISNIILKEQIGCLIGIIIIYLNFLYIIKLKTISFSLKPFGRFRKYYPFMFVIILMIMILLVGNIYSTMTTSKIIIKDAEGDDVDGHLTGQITVVNLGGTPVKGNIEIRMMINNSTVTLDSKSKMEGFEIWKINVDTNQSYDSLVYLYVDERLEDTIEMDVCYDVIIATLICSIGLLFTPKVFKRNLYKNRKKSN